MNAAAVLRYTVLVLSSAMMIAGVVVILGYGPFTRLPENFRYMMGIVIVLYGLYRFVIAFFRKAERGP